MSTPPSRAPLARHLHGPLDDDSAPVLVLCHGITDSSACWVEAIERWTAAGYRIVALDARGHGDSPRWQAEDLVSQVATGTRLATDLEEALEDLRAHGLRPRPSDPPSAPLTAPVVLVGHSMGGVTSLDVAARRPELVEAVIAEDPAFTNTAWKVLLRLNAPLLLREMREIAADPDAYFDAELAANPTWSPRELRASVEASCTVDTAFLSLGCVGPPTPWEEVVDGLSVPTLVMTGTGRVVLSAENLAALSGRRNPHIAVGVLAGAGHCVRRTYPERFHALTDPWLERRLAGLAPAR